MAHSILSEVVNEPRWDALPDLAKRGIFSKALTFSHRVAAAQALTAEKRTTLIGQITEQMAIELAPAEIQ